MDRRSPRTRAFAGLAFVLALAVGCVTHPPLRGEPPEAHGGLLGEGLASYYGPGLWGHRTASGERLEPGSRVAAHRTLPFGTCLLVQSKKSGRTTHVRVADRGPFVADRVLDVSLTAAEELGLRAQGVGWVRFWRCR